MAAPNSGGTNPVIFTAAGQTLSGACKVSYVVWDPTGTTASGVCALREGAASTRVVILRAAGSSGVQEASPGIWVRDLNVATLTRGTVRVYSWSY